MESSITEIHSIIENFDNAIDAKTLLKNIGKDRLCSLLSKILGKQFRLIDNNNDIIFNNPSSNESVKKTDIIIDFDHLFTLETWQVTDHQIFLAIEVIKTLSHSVMCYLMTAKLHVESINEDYVRLCEKNKQLEASEEKYRELCETLESKVKSQVKTIELAQNQIYQNEKLASVGRLAAGIAHEINTPLCYIQGNISAAIDYSSIIADINTYFEKGNLKDLISYWKDNEVDFLIEDLSLSLKDCQAGIDKTTNIINNLKDFSSVDREERCIKTLESIVTSTCNVFGNSIANNITLEVDMTKTTPISCNPGFIGQALLNILTNAAQAIGEQTGRINLAVTENTDYVSICIKDSGTGISTDCLNKVCDPFYTTREVGSGVGLGLTVVNDVANSHGGYLDISNQDSSGAAITLHLRKTAEI